MPSFKRRRSININDNYVDMLKCAAKRIGAKTPTSAASMILTGTAPPLVQQDVSGPSVFRGISMTEAIWFSIKVRACKVDKVLRVAAEDILTGKEQPLTLEEISLGESHAKERETHRESGHFGYFPVETDLQVKSESHVVESKIKPENHEPKKIHSDLEKSICDEGDRRRKMKRMKLSKGNTGVECRNSDRKLEPEQAEYGGVFTV